MSGAANPPGSLPDPTHPVAVTVAVTRTSHTSPDMTKARNPLRFRAFYPSG